MQLCRYYLDQFGAVLHHNVDKVLLSGGSARAWFGGGEVLYPIEIYFAGRATQEYHGKPVPVAEIAEDACRDWLKTNVPTLDINHDVRVIPRIRSGSTDLIGLFEGSRAAGAANDTSCAAGFAPLSDLEKIVLKVERTLNSPQIKQLHPAIGADIKVMGVRDGDHIELTISCALVSRYVTDLDDYNRQKDTIKELAIDAARQITSLAVTATVNAADNLDTGRIFLTITGTSAEAGDDGEAGLGNRTCGLITPYRVMTMEATAGKNPMTHVGKLYNLLASRIANAIVSEIKGVAAAQCVLTSQIGRPVTDPQIVDICLAGSGTSQIDDTFRGRVSQTVLSAFETLDALRQDLLAGRVGLY